MKDPRGQTRAGQIIAEAVRIIILTLFVRRDGCGKLAPMSRLAEMFQRNVSATIENDS